ncbi:MAG: hypothetical protein WCD27_15735 [Candidatus Acidiferrales bacterium]
MLATACCYRLERQPLFREIAHELAPELAPELANDYAPAVNCAAWFF